MTAPTYQEFDATEIPVERDEDGTVIRVIAGVTPRGTTGPAQRPSTTPTYFDVDLAAGATFEHAVPSSHAAVLFTIEGELAVGPDDSALPQRHLGVLGEGERIVVTAGEAPARFLLIAARRLEEPVARHGPFVMNTREQIVQAFNDYQNGRF